MTKIKTTKDLIRILEILDPLENKDIIIDDLDEGLLKNIVGAEILDHRIIIECSRF